MAMMDMRTATFFVCVGLVGAGLVGCGDDGTGPTSGTSTDAQTTESDDTSSGPSGDPTTESNSEPTDGTVSMSGTSEPTTGTTVEPTTTGDLTVTTTDPDPTTTEVDPECGNAIPEGTEECDDGNQVDGDGCESNCTTTPECGNSNIEVGEVCDDGNTMDGDTCSADCTMETIGGECGDGMVQDPEDCDDGNQTDGDGCESDCTTTPADCGNGVLEAGEVCDDGNVVNGGPNDFCLNNCTPYNPPGCQAPGMYAVCDADLDLADKADKSTAHKAMGICNALPTNSVLISEFQFDAMADVSWQVARGFGSYTLDHDMDPMTPEKLLYSPREGESFLMVSTGKIAAPDGQGIVTEAVASQIGNNNNGNPDMPNSLPPPLSDAVGSDDGAGGTPFIHCDGVNDCSDTLDAQWNIVPNPNPDDKLFFKLKTKVPPGTRGYKFDFVFCSSEYPEYVDTKYNDLFIAWQIDPSADNPNADPPVDPYTGNVTFVPDPNDPTKGLPLTITALQDYFAGDGFSDQEPQLAGTGFQKHACSNWFTAKGGVQPAADLEIAFFLADMGDSNLATLAILDNFRWDCEGCVPSEVDDCGVQQPD
jgi:cysteine-rich repeat protein